MAMNEQDIRARIREAQLRARIRAAQSSGGAQQSAPAQPATSPPATDYLNPQGTRPFARAVEGSLDALLGLSGGVVSNALDIGARLVPLADAVIPAPGNPLQELGIGDALRSGRDATQEFFAEQAATQVVPGSGQTLREGPGLPFTGGNIAGTMASEGLSYVYGGGAVRSGAGAVAAGARGPVARALQALGRRGGGGLKGQTVEALKDAAAVAPLDIAASIDPATSTAAAITSMVDATDAEVDGLTGRVLDVMRSASEAEGVSGVLARGAIESGLGTVADVGVRALGAGARGARRTSEGIQGRIEEEKAARVAEDVPTQLTEQDELELAQLTAERESNLRAADLQLAEDPLDVLRETLEERIPPRLTAEDIQPAKLEDGTSGNPPEVDDAVNDVIREHNELVDEEEAYAAARLMEEQGEIDEILQEDVASPAQVRDEEAKQAARDDLLASIDARAAELGDGLAKERLLSTRRQIADGQDPRLFAERLEAHGIDSRMVQDAGAIIAPQLDLRSPSSRAAVGLGGGLIGAEETSTEERARNAIIGAAVLTTGPAFLRALDRAAGGRSGHLVNLLAENMPRGEVQAGTLTMEPKVSRLVKEMKGGNTMPAENWERQFFDKDGKPKGFRQIEDDHYGMREFFQSRAGQKISKEQVLAHIEANQPVIEVHTLVADETTLDIRTGEREGVGREGLEGADSDTPIWADEAVVTEVRGPSQSLSDAAWATSDQTGDPLSRRVTGYNHREIIISLPENARAPGTQFVAPSHTGDTRNPLVWMRLSERQNADGEWVLYVEERQSDMEQLPRNIARMRRDAGMPDDPTIGPEPYPTYPSRDGTQLFNPQRLDEDDLLSAISPDFAYNNRTAELAARYLVAEARRRGIKHISWTPGDLQLQRNEKGGLTTKMRYESRALDFRDRPQGALLAEHPNGRMMEWRMLDEALESWVGPDMAAQLRADSGRRVPLEETSAAGDRVRELNRGLDADIAVEAREMNWQGNKEDVKSILQREAQALADAMDGGDLSVEDVYNLEQAAANRISRSGDYYEPDNIGHPEAQYYVGNRMEEMYILASEVAEGGLEMDYAWHTFNEPTLVSSSAGLARQYNEGMARAFRNVMDKEAGMKGRYSFTGTTIKDLEAFEHQMMTLPDSWEGARNFQLFSHGAVGGAALGGIGGGALALETDNEDAIGSFILGGALVGGGAATALQRRVLNRFSKIDGGISDEEIKLLTNHDNADAVMRTLSRITRLGGAFPKSGIEPESSGIRDLADQQKARLRSMRQAVTRSTAPIEDISEDVANTIAQGRGYQSAAEVMLEREFMPMLRRFKDKMTAIRAVGVAERGMELYRLGKDTDPDELRSWKATSTHLLKDPEVAEGHRQLLGFYRKLLEMKRDEGVISQGAFEDIVAKGDKYIPFLPQDIVDVVSRGGTVYRPNNNPGIRQMSKRLNQEEIVDPYVQAIRDTYETFRRVARHKTGQAVAVAVENDPEGTSGLLTKLDKEPDMRGKERDSIMPVLRGDQLEYYQIHDPLLAKAWRTYDGGQEQTSFGKTIAKMRRGMQYGTTIAPVFQVRNGIRDFFMSAAQYPLRGGGRALGTSAAVGGVAGAAYDEEDRARGALLGAAAGASVVGGAHMLEHAVRTADAMTSILGPDTSGMLFGGLMGYAGTDEEAGFLERMKRTAAGSAIGYGSGNVASRVLGDRLPSILRKDNDLLTSYLSNGGGQSGLFSQVQQDADKMLDRLMTHGVSEVDVFHPQDLASAVDMITHPLRTLLRASNQIGGAIEQAPRLARYKYELNQQIKQGSDPEFLDYGAAIFAARDQGLDFATGGGNQFVRGLTNMTPFLNPALIGLDKLVRMAADKKTYPVVAATMAAPTIGLWMLNHMDEDLREQWTNRQQWERDNYWLVPKKYLPFVEGNEGFIRVAKPFELGFMGASAFERTLDALYDVDPALAALSATNALDDDTAARLLGTARSIGSGLMSTTISPTMLFGAMPAGPMVQAGMLGGEHGYDAFTGRPINPYPWRNVTPEQQASPYTSSVARWAQQSPVLSKVLAGAGFDTPAKIDFAIRAYGGTLATQVSEGITDIARYTGVDTSAPPPERGGIFSRAFVTREGTTTQRETLLRQRYDEAEEYWNTFNLLMQQGDAAKVADIMSEDEYKRGVQTYMVLRPYKNMLDAFTSTRRMIRDNPSLDATEKDQAIVELNQAIAGVAQQAGLTLSRVQDTRED